MTAVEKHPAFYVKITTAFLDAIEDEARHARTAEECWQAIAGILDDHAHAGVLTRQMPAVWGKKGQE